LNRMRKKIKKTMDDREFTNIKIKEDSYEMGADLKNTTRGLDGCIRLPKKWAGQNRMEIGTGGGGAGLKVRGQFSRTKTDSRPRPNSQSTSNQNEILL